MRYGSFPSFPDEETDDPVVARLTAQTRRQEAALTGRLSQVIDTNPEQYAQHTRVARSMGVPTEAVTAMPELVQEARINEIKDNMTSAPRLQQRIAEDDAFARLAIDDTSNLSAIERTLNFAKNLGRSALAAVPQYNEGMYGFAQGATEFGAALLDPLVGTILPANPLAQMADAANRQRLQSQQIRTSLEKARGEVGVTENAFYGGVQSGVNMLLNVPQAAITRDPRAFLWPAAVQTGGQAYGDARDEGLSPVQALPFAASQAMIEYATERLPGIKLLEGLQTRQPVLQLARDFLAREIPGEQVATALQDLNEWAVLNPEKPFSEYLAERPEAAYSTLVATIVGGSIQVGAGKAIEAVAGRFAPQDAAAEAAMQDREALAQLDQLAAASLVRARDPQSFQQYVASALEDGPVSDVYIDAQALQNTGQLEALMQASPAVAEQFAEAASTGGTVRIPFDEYATTIAGTELNQGLVDHVKLQPDGMTFAESEQYQQTYAEEFNRQVDQALAANQADENFRQSATEIKTTIKDQLAAAGHTSASVNESYASLASAYYAVRAAQMGVTPQQLYDRIPLQVTGQSLTGETFSQGGLDTVEQAWRDAGIDSAISERDGTITLSKIGVPEAGRNQGAGTAAMQALVDYADRTGQHIVLSPSADFGGNKKRLTGFYKRFGFVENKGSNRAFSTSESMYREASGRVLYQGEQSATEQAAQKWRAALAQVHPNNPDYVPKLDTPAAISTLGIKATKLDLPSRYLQAIRDKHPDVPASVYDNLPSLLADPEFAVPYKDGGYRVFVDAATEKGEPIAVGVGMDGRIHTITPIHNNPGNTGAERAREALERGLGQAGAKVYARNKETLAKAKVSEGAAPATIALHRNSRNKAIVVTRDQLVNKLGSGFYQGPRGSYSPDTNTIALLRNADLSTFLHELGHAFLAMDTTLAASLLEKGTLTEGENQMLADAGTLLSWFGIEGEINTQLATWQGMSLDEQREHHEKFAEGFEAYLFEGKAPRLDLQPVFQRFRAWLANVYRQVQSYLTSAGEQLTPEVRSVMDRMLADTEQIQQAEAARGMAPIFKSAEEAGMTQEQFMTYLQDNVQGTQDAITDLEARSLKDMTWTSRLKERTVAKLNKEARTLRKAARQEVAVEIDQEPVYAALRFFKRGETTGPNGDLIQVEAGNKLSIPDLEKLYPPGELANHPDWRTLGYGKYGVLGKEGINPDLAAEIFGFASGDDLVRSMLDAQPRDEVIEAVTDQRMLEEHGELSSPEAISRAADEAIHNDVRTRVISTELAGLQRALGSALNLSRMAKDYARQVVGKTRVRDLRPNKFATDAAKAGKRADAAMRKGNRDEAITEKRNQLVNHATTKEAYEAQAEVQKAMQQFRRIATAKLENLKDTRNMDLVNATRAVLAEYGIGTRSQNPREYLDLVREYDPELYAALEPDLVQAQSNARPIDTLTLDEFRALRDQVDSLWYMARREMQMEVDGRLVDREQVLEALSGRLDELGIPESAPGEGQAVTEAEKRGRYLRGLRAALRRVEGWVDRMDGGNISGAFRSYLFTPISEAADNYRNDAGTYIRRFRDLLRTVEPSLIPGRIAAPELGYTFGYSKGDAGMSELLHAILHTGNESNKRKLLLGRGWAIEREDGTVDTSNWDRFTERMIGEGRLGKQHFDFAQGVWDLLEDTKPLAQRTHREVFGRYFAEVTADEFTNQFGTYRGGYVPAITDTFEVQDAAINAALDDVNQGNAYMFPSTSRGFTKARVEYNRPLALDLRLIPQHIDKVLLFAHMERHVRDVQRVLKGVSGKLNRYDPVAYTDLLLPWLNRAAKQTVETPIPGWAGKASKIFAIARSRAGMATMFANVTNALQQITGFSITLLKVKPTYLRQAMGQYVQSPSAMAEAAAALSPFMAERLENQTFRLRDEIEDLLINPSKYEQSKNWVQQHAYILQSTFQNVVDVISWSGAYNQGLAEGASDVEAIRAANAAVRETQGSLKPEDISRFETGTAFTRMFTQFASYFNMQANVLGTEFAKVAQGMGLRKGAGRAFYVLLFGFLAPAWAAEAIVIAMRGGPGDDDNDGYLDEFLAFFFGAPLRNAAAMVPIAGPAVVTSIAAFNTNPNDDRLANAPAINALEAAVNSPSSIYNAIFEDAKASRAIKDSLSVISMITGVPVSALGRPLGYMADVYQEHTDPVDSFDALRGSLTGISSSDSRR